MASLVLCFFLELSAFKSRLFSDQLCLGFLQDYVDAPLSIPVSLTQSLNIDWSEYQVSKAGVSGRSEIHSGRISKDLKSDLLLLP